MNTTTYIEEFESNISKHSLNAAIIYENVTFTYYELNHCAEKYCGEILQNINFQSKSVISIHLKSSLDIIVSIFAILKANCTFLVIDTEAPNERIYSIIEDSGTTLVITDNNKFDYQGKPTIKTPEWSNTMSEEPIITMRSSNDNNASAYIVYTSGSTGKPNGVLISNESLLNYCYWLSRFIKLTDSDKTLLLSSFAHDLGYTSIFPILLAGGTLHLMDKEKYLTVDYVVDYIRSNRLSFLKLTPTYYSLLINNENFSRNYLSYLRVLIFGGEAINPTHVIETNKKYPNLQIINHYGPCEATIGAIANYVQLVIVNESVKIPLGKPIDNTIVILLDEALRSISDANVEGEIYIGGKGVSLGYVNNLQLTKEKFVTILYEGEKILFYKTGDIGYYTEENDICFVGRTDRQVKIKGYRIELNEIEKIISTYPSIIKVAVIIQKKSSEILVYYTSKNEIDSKHIHSFLNKKLPPYMLPKYYHHVEYIPMLGNGKVDYNKLPQIEIAYSKNIIDNSNSIHSKFANIWNKYIDNNETDNDVSFFDLGGDSLSFVMMLSDLDEEFSTYCPYYLFIKNPTFNNILWKINNTIVSQSNEKSHDNSSLDKIAFTKQVTSIALPLNYCETKFSIKDLIPTQKIQILDKNIARYIVPEAIILDSHEATNIESILLKVINVNLLLKSKIEIDQRRLIVYEFIDGISLLKIDLSEYSDNDFKDKLEFIIQKFYTPFDYGIEFLHRALFVKLKNKYVLLVFKSHLITDGVINFSELIHSLSEGIIYDGNYDAYIEDRKKEILNLSVIEKKKYDVHFTYHFKLTKNFLNHYPIDILHNNKVTDNEFEIKFDFFSKSDFVPVIVTLFALLISKKLHLTELPITLFYNGRHYKNQKHYFNIVGDLHDNYMLNVKTNTNIIDVMEQIKIQLDLLGYGIRNNFNILSDYLNCCNRNSVEILRNTPFPIIINIEFVKENSLTKEDDIALLNDILVKNKKSSVKYLAVGVYISKSNKNIKGAIRSNSFFAGYFHDCQDIIDDIYSNISTSQKLV